MSLSHNRPIGVFDSGVGGLTVANAIRKILPNENIVYYGDLAHFPYGEKSPDAIQYYSKKITEFLLSRFDCKLVLIACNTASAHASDIVKGVVKEKIPVINMIDPIIHFVTNEKEYNSIGVIATKGTVTSDMYRKKISKLNCSLKISSLATPLFASMIEEGFINDEVSDTIIRAYLSKDDIRNIDALILGCTHYPLIKEQIERFYNSQVEVIDANEIVAQETLKVLKKASLLNDVVNSSKYQFFASDYTDNFESISKMFFGGEMVKLQKVRL